VEAECVHIPLGRADRSVFIRGSFPSFRLPLVPGTSAMLMNVLEKHTGVPASKMAFHRCSATGSLLRDLHPDVEDVVDIEAFMSEALSSKSAVGVALCVTNGEERSAPDYRSTDSFPTEQHPIYCNRIQ
jgi:hypothetical protein